MIDLASRGRCFRRSRSLTGVAAAAALAAWLAGGCQQATERTPAEPAPVAEAAKRAPAPVAPPSAPPAAAPAASAPRPAIAVPTNPRSIDDYKKVFAAQVLKVNAAKTFEGRPPHFLNAIVVLEITMDNAGRPTRVNVMRTPSHARHLGKVASDTVRAAGPYLAPPKEVLRTNRQLVFTETWLFRDDEKFQIRSLALEQ